MTTQEFSSEFDILYDNISNNSARGINNYEKSVFLTMAQEELIKNYKTGLNTVHQSFESNEEVRRILSSLHIDYKNKTPFTNSNAISSGSRFFQIPENTYAITFEELKIISDIKCQDGKYIEVKPITHDEYNKSIKNPFRKINKRKAWRLDISNQDGDNVVEIISSSLMVEYHCRYIEKPTPIILSNIESDPELQGMNLTIDGLNTLQECKLNQLVHRYILNNAVDLAIMKYRENTLQNNVQSHIKNV